MWRLHSPHQLSAKKKNNASKVLGTVHLWLHDGDDDDEEDDGDDDDEEDDHDDDDGC
jgi:hypothetical protein